MMMMIVPGAQGHWAVKTRKWCSVGELVRCEWKRGSRRDPWQGRCKAFRCVGRSWPVICTVNQHRPKYAIYIGHIEPAERQGQRGSRTSTSLRLSKEREREIGRAAEFFQARHSGCNVLSRLISLMPRAYCHVLCARSLCFPRCAAGANRRLLTLTFCAAWLNSCSRCCCPQPAIRTAWKKRTPEPAVAADLRYENVFPFFFSFLFFRFGATSCKV